jgi:hypothetical protein
MAAGLIMAVLTLFMAPMSLREFCTSVNRRDFVPDELQLERFSEAGGDSPSLEARLVTTGEHYRPDTSIVGLDRLRELSRGGKVEGYRVPVRYLPKSGGFWAGVDRVNQFRVRTPDDFDDGFPAGLVAANLVIAMASILLIRRGAGFTGRAI